MKSNAELRNECWAKISEAIDKASKLYGMKIPVPQVIFRPMGTMGGRCTHSWMSKVDDGKIELNTALLAREQDLFVARTPVHEVAHWINYWVFGGKGHDRGWKRIMNDLGLEASRCHNYDTSGLGRKSAKFSYHCNCQNFELTSVRVNKIAKGAKYFCKSCRGELKSGKL